MPGSHPSHAKRWPTLLAALIACMAGVSCFGTRGDGFPASPEDPPGRSALLERLPIDLLALDYDVLATKRQAWDSWWLPLQDYGHPVPSTDGMPAKTNPQPTFYAPLGTPVLAIVSGVVSSVSRLYSGDSTVWIASGGGPTWEMEHVINVRVRRGDRVMAGDTIAEVSDYECKWFREGNPADAICASGLGLVEIGLLYGGSPPRHRCPFEPQLVAADARTAVFGQLDTARARIKAAFGDPALFDEDNRDTPHCITLDRVRG